MPQLSFITFLLRLFARRRQLAATDFVSAGTGNNAAPASPQRPNHAIRFVLILGRISRNWGPLGCWTALSYFIATTGGGADVFRSLSNRLAESTFLVRLVSYLFRWFGRETGSVDLVADTVEHVATFFRHASAAFKSAKDVVTKLSKSSNAASDENNNTTSKDPPDSTFSGDQEVNHSASVDGELRIISSIEEGMEIISQWKEGGGAFSVDVPLDMPAKRAKDLMAYFRGMGVACLLEGPNVKSILEKELASAQCDLEMVAKCVADLQSLMRAPSSTDRKTDS